MKSQRRVAFLPFTHISLKSLIPKPYDFKPKTLGEHIKKMRLMKGMLQKELAKLIGVSIETIINWEKGHHKPEKCYIPSLSKFLGLEVGNIRIEKDMNVFSL